MTSMSEIEWKAMSAHAAPSAELVLRFEREAKASQSFNVLLLGLTLDRRPASARVRETQYGRTHRS